jgi:MYXO-CTERM domain-containing protein
MLTRFRGVVAGAALAAFVSPAPARAATFNYVDWETADPAQGTASGVITLPDASVVNVTFQALNDNDTPGTLYGAQVSGGTNFWNPAAPYISAEVENSPPDTDIIQLAGGLNQTYRVLLSEPIKDPVMAIVSLGSPGIGCTYDFDSPFTIVSQGVGYWGGSDTALTALEGDVLQGYEGHGTIRFIGTFSTFSWTVPTTESWHGFTFAIRTTEALEPSEGGAGGGGAGGPAAGGADDGSGGADGSAAGETGLGGAADGLGGAGGTPPSAGGSDDSPDSNAGEGGETGDARDHTKDDGGCGCSMTPRGLGSSALAAAAALALGVLRRRKSRR